MRTTHLNASASAAAIASAFPRGPRIAFAPDAGAGSARPTPKPVAARKDDAGAEPAPAAAPDKMDRVLALMEKISEQQEAASARLDALEKGGKPDPDAKTAEKDDEDVDDKPGEPKPRAKADAADLSRFDREIGVIKGRMSPAERDTMERELAATQAKADAAYNLHGKRAPMPLDGERPLAYRARLAGSLKKFSPAFKEVDLTAIARADRPAFDSIEARIYADSAAASERPEVPAGELLMRTRRDPGTDREVREFFGPQTFIKGMQPPVMSYVKSFNTGHPGQA